MSDPFFPEAVTVEHKRAPGLGPGLVFSRRRQVPDSAAGKITCRDGHSPSLPYQVQRAANLALGGFAKRRSSRPRLANYSGG